ncbi:ABC transporter substrate-binding protein [Azospirillum sp. TSO22-1]|uniref:ABC transporter substrate-binding protein n=1 Tax=Azospirillum sp. TSO22-1 TaxID=716789 RepID=UPI000D6033F2|nr:ABC transporter substrate-binding protein [Azospirillum sp. TSO22-1]PWC54642.1 ABC transporter substrate-binding protein [Azospirillum sp. TSO22-1]
MTVRFGGESAVSRRGLLKLGAAAGLALPLGAVGARALSAAPAAGLKPLKFAWNTGGVCGAPVAVALHKGIYAKHGLDVEFINFAGSTEQLLESLATGKADAGIGMALRWLKPLEQGFDVKITAGTHGGCMRLLAAKTAGIADIKGLRGKAVAISDLSSPAKHFFSIVLAKLGIDGNKEVEWKVFPGDLLGAAVERGEAHAVAHWDPVTFNFLKSGNLVEIATNLDGEFSNRVCCIVGVRGSLLREDKPTAAALTRALIEAHDYTAAHPEEAAAVYQQYSPKSNLADLTAMLKSETHNHHPVGGDLKKELALYTDELKLMQIFKPTTDTAKFADKIYADVLA